MYILEDFVRIKREFCVCECEVTYKLDQIERHMIHFSAVVWRLTSFWVKISQFHYVVNKLSNESVKNDDGRINCLYIPVMKKQNS